MFTQHNMTLFLHDRPDPFESGRSAAEIDARLGSESDQSDEESSKGQAPPIKLAMWVSAPTTIYLNDKAYYKVNNFLHFNRTLVTVTQRSVPVENSVVSATSTRCPSLVAFQVLFSLPPDRTVSPLKTET